jgi:hypothetical protein
LVGQFQIAKMMLPQKPTSGPRGKKYGNDPIALELVRKADKALTDFTFFRNWTLRSSSKNLISPVLLDEFCTQAMHSINFKPSTSTKEDTCEQNTIKSCTLLKYTNIHVNAPMAAILLLYDYTTRSVYRSLVVEHDVAAIVQDPRRQRLIILTNEEIKSQLIYWDTEEDLLTPKFLDIPGPSIDVAEVVGEYLVILRKNYPIIIECIHLETLKVQKHQVKETSSVLVSEADLGRSLIVCLNITALARFSRIC